MTAERDDRELNRFWNDIAAGDPGTAGDVDPDGARLIRGLHSLANAPLPASARERVWRGLLDTYISTPETKEQTMLTTADHAQNGGYRTGGTTRIRLAKPQPPRSLLLTRPVVLALAATLVLGLFGGIAGAWRFTTWGDSGQPKGGPAIYAPGTPAPDLDIGIKTLIEVTLPADVVPADLRSSMHLALDTIPANTVTTRDAWSCCPGTKPYLILDGNVSLGSDGLIQVIRHDTDGSIENVARGQTADLGPGDVAIVRNEDNQTWTAGAAEVDIVTAALVGGSVPGSTDPTEWINNDYALDDFTLDLPGGPYELRLEQTMLNGDATIPLPEQGVNQLAIVRDGAGGIGRNSDGSISVAGVNSPTTLLIVTLTTTAAGSGTPVAGMSASPVP
jgi:hypothetical protein